MIIGYDCFGENEEFDTQALLTDVSLLEFKGMMLDSVYMETAVKDEFTCELPEWNDNTVLRGDFKGTTECGSIGANGFEITDIAIKKRREGEMEWEQIAEFAYESSDDGFLVFEGTDKYVEALETYEYAITPKAGNVEGSYNISSVTVDFNEAYIFDADNYYELTYDFKYGSITKQTSSASIETLGGRYPVVIYNGAVDYFKGSVNCKVLFVQNGDYDRKKTKELRNNFLEFLLNKKPKMLKSEDGLYLMINIVDTPSLSFNAKANNVYDLSFNFVEVADVDDYEAATEYGLIGVEQDVIR